MSKQQRIIYDVMGVLLGLVLVVGFLKYFNIHWIESTTSYTKITINFLVPMNQNNLQEHIELISEDNNQNAFNYSIYWINNHTAEIILKEQGEIKGQKIIFKINHAPSQYDGIYKSTSLPIQLKADIQLLSSNEFLISSTRSFIVAFNTPISLQQVYKSLQSEAKFQIKPYKNTNDTQFIFTPEKALSNGQIYILLFKAGMCAKSGTLLKEDQAVILHVDQKPTITKTYPINGDKWIGLYPRILLESGEDITNAEAYINGVSLKGKLINSKKAYFLLDDLLQPETCYHLTFQVQSASGEVSELKQIDFTTTTLNDKRFWMDIHVGNSKEIRCYLGTKCIKTIPFETSQNIDSLTLGTYYLQGKSEVYEDPEHNLGGNYWVNISNQLGIQGTLRDAYWQPINNLEHAKNMIITDEEAAWLYEKLEHDTMIVVRR